MEKNQNPFPKMDIVPGVSVLRKLARFAGSLLVPFHCEPSAYLSDHYREAPLDTPVEPVTDLGSPYEKYCVLGIIPTSEWREEA